MMRFFIVFLAIILAGCDQEMTPAQQRASIDECHKYKLNSGEVENFTSFLGDFGVTKVHCYYTENK